MPAEPAPRRKLAAILSADVAGYSRLMGEDETATLGTLNTSRAVFAQLIVQHQGRLVDTAGDSVLALFESVVEAVQCATDVQQALHAHNQALLPTRRMQFRMGVNLGDVLQQADGSIYGDSVNVAARLQALDDPGGLCISGTAYDQIKHKLALAFDSLGEQSVKNITDPVRVYRVRPETPAAAQRARRRVAIRAPTARQALIVAAALLGAAGALGVWQYASRPGAPPPQRLAGPAPALTLPDTPSLAVLPFVNLSGQPDDEWFTDGMTETLITDLSRLNNLFVIARNSTFTYKGKPVDVRRVGHDLGVRYVLEGSVQRSGERVRVNAQLVEAPTGRHLWAERYDRPLADLFDIQDELTQRVVTALDVTLLAGEQALTWRKTTRNVHAYGLFLQGQVTYYRFTREDNARAQGLFQQSLDLDPSFTMGIVYLGWTHHVQGYSGWSPDPQESYLKALALGRQAAALDPSLGPVYKLLSGVLLVLGEHAEAVAAAEKALALSPNDADILSFSGAILALHGRAEEGVALAQRALRRNPFPPAWYFSCLGASLLFANRVAEALPVLRQCVERLPDFVDCRCGLTMAYVKAGKLAQATAQAREFVRINPKSTAEDNVCVRAIGVPEQRARAVEALRRAGLK
jgi:adenylate cyclase